MFHFNGPSSLIDICYTTKLFHFRRQKFIYMSFFSFSYIFILFFLLSLVLFSFLSFVKSAGRLLAHLFNEPNSYQTAQSDGQTSSSFYIYSSNEEISFRLCDEYLFCKRSVRKEGKIPSSSSSSS